MHWAIWDAKFKARRTPSRGDRQPPEPLYRRDPALVHLPARLPLHGAFGRPGATTWRGS